MSKPQWYEGTGRRKTAIARVRVFLGKEPMTINGVAVDSYFPGASAKREYERPLSLVNRLDSLTATVKVLGGGSHSQLGALVHGLANALIKFDPTFRSQLSVAGLLTRDSRMKESRKFGLAGKARAKKQSPKR
ncbi:MAG: 30S ribosomal protein S9 [Candidatus Woykebacteria bacterium RIFCSPHIGHO2_12_FULL_43_10]|uniref:Small ribosomal subunit protein uS9 n=2 Tax=Candidatus Woykeibacteriota TaxID=1817899 RepID=A0A1G1WXK3_9BACT|nr:MAG: 30S ribosomal protein S9 [Candidatus Woykebacteria bacterium RIFCSPHIGHO2_01_FULL_43_29]OGY28752.1 MAG: 30S ribosomal protein S9 [Candidatus Woykebacteria bacterium RIFCSPHIGHO2_02_FULL_43_16b]OGY29815.1 MAG: 30S ribosomal protein S9 [Candidatus Woykebacteria bacterium RIFCSPHIGHO2_12_FULL_43_10]OGY32492.1 MAG: 30S ribosomal protein S9 [Candidatus Woykebacteria bacterium RIFCSPLOWO2_01_FULL_43_14]